jgi:hypothetical protein
VAVVQAHGAVGEALEDRRQVVCRVVVLLCGDQALDNVQRRRLYVDPDSRRVEAVDYWERWISQAMLLSMDISQIIDFLQTTLGQAVLGAVETVYEFLFPSNAPGAPKP